MKLTLNIIAAALLMTLGQCTSKQQTTESAMPQSEESAEKETPKDDPNAVRSLVIDPAYTPVETDPLTIQSVSMDGDTLVLLVQYGGGCRDHEFVLVSNQ
ncbi:MAG: hypothetical protein HKN32_09910, partial [Flavobacteriales bacterium]|nr:hypothetical protein [Flavobacteriales bacterium]